MDQRAIQLAEKVLDYSIGVKPGDRLLIQSFPDTQQFEEIFGQLAKDQGVGVTYDPLTFSTSHLKQLFLRNDPHEWADEKERRMLLYNWCNTRVLLDSEHDSSVLSDIPNLDKLMAKYTEEIDGPSRKILLRKDPYSGYAVRWNLVGFPTSRKAVAAGINLDDFSDFVYGATLLDWEEIAESMNRYKDVIDGAKELRIEVPGLTNLILSLEGRGAKVCAGKHNMPDGEFYYGPVEDSAQGYITYQIPSLRDGRVFENIRFELEDGLIVSSSTSNDMDDALCSVLDVKGARRFGELGIGCNYGIRKPALDILFDEKIGGTIHTAIGESFLGQPLESGGGLNESHLHWDLICDLRRNDSDLARFPGGKIYVDGKLVQEHGYWKI